MFGILYLLLFLAGGVLIAQYWLPRRRALIRWYLGAALGVILMMWLPALWAYAVDFSLLAHVLAAGTLGLLVTAAYFTMDKSDPLLFSDKDKKNLKLLLFIALPLTLLAGYLEYTHSIRPAADGYHVGQSTYGDLSLHLAVAASAVNAAFPLHNSLMAGATLVYPYLSDTITTSMLMMGLKFTNGNGVYGHAAVRSGVFGVRAAVCRAVPQEGRGGAGGTAAVCKRRAGLFLHAFRHRGKRRDDHAMGSFAHHYDRLLQNPDQPARSLQPPLGEHHLRHAHSPSAASWAAGRC